jgi:hypothetical protein
VLAKRSSDHHPILLQTNYKKHRMGKIFRLNACWTKDKEFTEVIHKAWTSDSRIGDPWVNFHGKIQRCKKQIQRWVRKKEWATEGIIKEKSEKLKSIQEESNPNDFEKEKELKEELQRLMEQEELSLKQRAKVDWLRHGDKNSKYFHACVRQRQRRNSVEKINDAGGQLCTTQEAIEKAFVGYFEALFTSRQPAHVDRCINAITRRLSVEMNAKLDAPFGEAEILEALTQMAAFKAPGPDGFTADFYQQNWAIVGLRYVEWLSIFLTQQKWMRILM